MRKELYQEAIEELAWSLENQVDVKEFNLVLARLNSVSNRPSIMTKIQEICPLKIQEIELESSITTLYTSIQNRLDRQETQAVIISGLENNENLDRLLTGANQMREEFQKNFPFPMVWWVTDEVFTKLLRVAPDLESWSITVAFQLSTNALITLIESTTNEVFERVLQKGATRSLDYVNSDLGISSRSRGELESARQELQQQGVKLDPFLEASLEFVLSIETNWSPEKALLHYEQSLKLWQKYKTLEVSKAIYKESFELDSNLYNLRVIKAQERQACLAYCLGVWWRTYAVSNRVYYEPACEIAKDYFEQCLTVFRQSNRIDLVAKFINALGDILERLEAWDELEIIGEKAVELHQTYQNPFRLARSYGFLAKATLGKKEWEKAVFFAKKAIDVSTQTPPDTQINTGQNKGLEWVRSYNQGDYYLVLAKAEKKLGLDSECLEHLEKGKNRTQFYYEPQLYIEILEEMRKIYFERGDYLKAYNFKKQCRSIQQQFGFRAFIGAGKLKPSQNEINNNIPSRNDPEGSIAREIIASGRESDLNKLIERLGRTDHKLTILYGQSGVGKSSLIRAGLLPALHQRSIGTRNIFTVFTAVYTDWLQSLSKGFSEQLEQEQQKTQRDLKKSKPNLYHLELLMTFDRPEAILQQLRDNANHNFLTVLIFDQFEDFFFVNENLSKRQNFYGFLNDCLNLPYVKVILSLREDYLYCLPELTRCQEITAINNNILDKNIVYYIGNFSQKQAKNLLEKLTKDSQLFLEPKLINTLIDDLSKTYGEVRPIELQIVGKQLQSEKITTFKSYQERGTKDSLVQAYLEEVIRDCGQENQRIAEGVLYLLTNENNIRPLKTSLELETELLTLTSLKAGPKLGVVLEILEESGLVARLPDLTAPRYQLVHDYLVPLIRKQQGETLRAQLKQAEAKQKESEVRRKQSEAHFYRVFTVGSVLTVLVLTFLSAYLFRAVQVSRYSARKAKLNEIQASITSAEALYKSHRTFDALKESIKSGYQIQQAKLIKTHTNIPILQNLEKWLMWSQNAKIATPELEKRVLTSLQEGILWIQEKNRLEGHTNRVLVVSFSPNGQIIASGGNDHTVRLWQQNGTPIATLTEHQGAVKAIAFSPTEPIFVTASSDGFLKVWSLDGRFLRNIPQKHNQESYSRGIETVSFSPDGKYLAWGAEDGTLVIQTPDGKFFQKLQSKQAPIRKVAFSPDGKIVASTSDDGLLKIWQFEGGKLLQNIAAHRNRIYGLDFSPDRQTFVTASWDGSLKIWSMEDIITKGIKQPIRTISQSERIAAIKFSPDGKNFAIASLDKTVNLWSVNGPKLMTLVGHTSQIYSLSFSPNGQLLASASGDLTIKLWDLKRELVKSLRGSGGNVFETDFSPSGNLIAAGGEDRTVKLWRPDGLSLTPLKGHTDEVRGVRFSPDGKIIASASADGTIKLWSVEKQQELLTIKNDQSPVNDVNFDRQGQLFVAGYENGTIIVWRLDGSQLYKIPQAHEQGLLSVIFSPDGRYLASSSRDGTIKVWRASGQPLFSLPAHESFVFDLSFSPDSKTLASASNDNTVKLWNVETRTLLKVLNGHEDAVTTVEFSPNGKLLATGSYDYLVKIWTAEGNYLTTLRGNDDRIYTLGFSDDSQFLVSGSMDRKVLLWDLRSLGQGNLDILLKQGCDWMWSYFQHNIKLSPQDRQICNGLVNEIEKP